MSNTSTGNEGIIGPGVKSLLIGQLTFLSSPSTILYRIATSSFFQIIISLSLMIIMWNFRSAHIEETGETILRLTPPAFTFFIIRYGFLSNIGWLHESSMARKCAILGICLSVYLFFNLYINDSLAYKNGPIPILHKTLKIFPRSHSAYQDSYAFIVARWIRITAYGLIPLALISMINHQDNLSRLLTSNDLISVISGIIATTSVIMCLFIFARTLTLAIFDKTLPLRQRITNAAELTVSTLLTGPSSYPLIVGSHYIVGEPEPTA